MDSVLRPRVGIPRGLLYYEYSDFWTAFLSSLGADVIVSPVSNPEIVDAGVRLAVDEACLPVKVFCGHVQSMADDVDYVFVPRVVSVAEREYTCPKLLGLPEMLSQQLEGKPCRVLSATVNLYHSARDLIEPCVEVARALGRSRIDALRALSLGLIKHAAHSRRRPQIGQVSSEGLRIGILGHRYLVEDEGINLGIRRHLHSLCVASTITEDDVPITLAARYARTLPKPLFWTYEKRAVGTALYLMDKHLVDGLIQLVSFGCGPDSMVASLTESHAHSHGMPYLLLSVDEHSGEAGTITRLEAFVDMLQWKRMAT